MQRGFEHEGIGLDAVDLEFLLQSGPHLRRAPRDERHQHATHIALSGQLAQQRHRARNVDLLFGLLQRGLDEIANRVELGAQIGLVEVPPKDVAHREIVDAVLL